MHTLHATESHSATIPHRDLGGAVAAQVRSRIAIKYAVRMAFFHRVLACSAEVRFPAETQHSQMLFAKDVDGSGQASTGA